MNKFEEIHKRAVQAGELFSHAEATVISSLQEVEADLVFLRYDCASLFAYAIKVMRLSENVAASCITVARKATQVPALKEAIVGGLSVSKARKIIPVLQSNPEEWILKARTLTSRKIEQAVAQTRPAPVVPERMKFVGGDRVELKVGISSSLQEKLQRVQDLESQRTGRAATLEETLEALANTYLESKDPVRRAERILNRRPNQSKRTSRDVSARARHEVHQRDQGRCTHKDQQGKRCQNRRWIDIHHIVPRAVGGQHTPDNLITLCSAHHRMEHA